MLQQYGHTHKKLTATKFRPDANCTKIRMTLKVGINDYENEHETSFEIQ